jgi:hypothetical protein
MGSSLAVLGIFMFLNRLASVIRLRWTIYGAKVAQEVRRRFDTISTALWRDGFFA